MSLGLGSTQGAFIGILKKDEVTGVGFGVLGML